MKLINFKSMVAVSAVALSFAMSAGPAMAAAYELDSGDPVNVLVTADVLQTVDVDVAQDIDFGNIGIKQDAADTATLVMAPDGSITEDLAGPARAVIDDNDTPLPASIDLTGGFPDTDIHVLYTDAVDLNCAGCLASEDLLLTDVLDSMLPAAVLTAGTGVQQGSLLAATEGIGTTTNAGDLSWEVGATITTVASANPYETGAYAGSFNMYLSY